jgi:hypothetical protein
MAPPRNQETHMNNDTRELSIDELDTVAGGNLAEFLGGLTNVIIEGALGTACGVLQGAVTIAKAVS